MDRQPLPLFFAGLPETWAETLAPIIREAAEALGATRDFSGIRICADDLPGATDAWYRLEPGQEPDLPPCLTIFCHPDSFGPGKRPGGAVEPARPVWESLPVPSDAPQPLGGISPESSAIFLYHHLLLACDLVRGEVLAHNVPAHLAEAFTEAWAVTVDGRLSREGRPGFPLAERRGRFARVFSPAGVLLPDHWQVFQSLWDGALRAQKDVLGAVKRLPGL